MKKGKHEPLWGERKQKIFAHKYFTIKAMYRIIKLGGQSCSPTSTGLRRAYSVDYRWMEQEEKWGILSIRIPNITGRKEVLTCFIDVTRISWFWTWDSWKPRRTFTYSIVYLHGVLHSLQKVKFRNKAVIVIVSYCFHIIHDHIILELSWRCSGPAFRVHCLWRGF